MDAYIFWWDLQLQLSVFQISEGFFLLNEGVFSGAERLPSVLGNFSMYREPLKLFPQSHLILHLSI